MNVKLECNKSIESRFPTLTRFADDDSYARTPHFYIWINISGGFYTADSNKTYECRVEVEGAIVTLLSLEVDGETFVSESLDKFAPTLHAQASPAQTANVIQHGNADTAPRVIRKVDPEYSLEARQAKLQSTVILSVIIDENGHARDFTVTQSLGLGLDEKAIEAVQKWIFQPGLRRGKPISVAAKIEVNFRTL